MVTNFKSTEQKPTKEKAIRGRKQKNPSKKENEDKQSNQNLKGSTEVESPGKT